MWRHSHYDVIRAARAHHTRNPRLSEPFSLWRYSHHDVIRDSADDAQCYGADTLPCLIYKDVEGDGKKVVKWRLWVNHRRKHLSPVADEHPNPRGKRDANKGGCSVL